ncbi:putative transcriptional regulator [Actinocorallia herbida]|uniref:Putative transcriptional regulator n=1 Tax=Actinocorallia herbida TaxID=58109 RepID=A0A3N1D102_9ACTN|nr:BlaI/MecI/CopY family transcriptional regulator [Actinocorallia herbida]ROO87199.1 putative transcriptional regulator [Actinocorallia herbida]
MSSLSSPGPDQGSGRRPSGQLERQIMTMLTEADRGLTPREVRDRLPELAYSTVVTILTRLHEKGVVARRRDGRAYRYVATSDTAGLVAGRMNRLLSDESDHASVLRRFVGSLDRQDEQLLRDLLRESED